MAVFAGVLGLSLLTGCVTTLVGGVMENSIEVTVEENSFSPAARGVLRNAKTLGVISMDRTSIKAADLLESRGGYIVKIDRLAAKAGEMTGSERREALSQLCKTQSPDVALLGRVVKTETGSTVAAAFTGRAKIDQNWAMDMLACRTNKFDSFGGALKLNVGIYNATAQAQIEEMIGVEIGTKILSAIGKVSMAGGESRQEAIKAVPPPSSGPATPVNPVSSPLPQVSASVETAPKPMANIEVQKQLNALGYQVGTPDGMLGKRSVDALKKFQQDKRIPVTGKADSETIEKLRLAGGDVAAK